MVLKSKKTKKSPPKKSGPRKTKTLIRESLSTREFTDRQLIQQAIENIHAEQALIELWDRYKKRLYLYIQYKIIRKPSSQPEQDQYIIEDVLQNVFTDVLCSLKEYNPQYEVSTWIYTVTNKHIMRYIREVNKARFRTVDIDDVSAVQYQPQESETPQTYCEAVEFEKILIRFIQALKKRVDQDVFILFIQNLNTHNISEFVGKTNDATRARISRIFEKFRRFLKRYYPEYYTTHIVSYMKDLDLSSFDLHTMARPSYNEITKG